MMIVRNECGGVEVQGKPRIEEYSDFRIFLRDLIEFLRREGKFSLRNFRIASGFKSNTHITMILDGRRNLTREGVRKVAKGLSLDGPEVQYLLHLVDFNQAQTSEEKDRAYLKLMKHKRFQKVRKTAQEEYEYYANWHRPVLLEALGSRAFAKKTHSQMAKAMGVTESEIKDSLKSLEKMGLIRKLDAGYRRESQFIQSASISQSVHVRNLHREMIKMALHSIDEVEKDKRELNALSVSLTQKQFQELKLKVFEFMQDIASLYSEPEDPETVYQLNLQFFPVVDLKSNE